MVTTMIVAGILLAVPSYLIRRHFDGKPPVWLAVGWAAFVSLGGGIVVIGTVKGVAGGLGLVGGVGVAMFGICFGLLALFPAISTAWLNIADLAANGFSSFIYDSSIVSPPPTSFGRARAKVVQGDLDGAVREFRVYFNENSKSPAPLFAATMCLELHQRHHDAVAIYQEIMRRFDKNAFVWTEAALRLAALYDNYLDNAEGATFILDKVVDRAPKKEQRVRAIQRLVSHRQKSTV